MRQYNQAARWSSGEQSPATVIFGAARTPSGSRSTQRSVGVPCREVPHLYHQQYAHDGIEECKLSGLLHIQLYNIMVLYSTPPSHCSHSIPAPIAAQPLFVISLSDSPWSSTNPNRILSSVLYLRIPRMAASLSILPSAPFSFSFHIYISLLAS
ncbi:hypothetical protein DL93DRAFT_2090966 [Clavulina sp. PMI_390]|nr:hypothetical protein DL93DRAFT_2090966 [Clavulina sp. PMI_390]